MKFYRTKSAFLLALFALATTIVGGFLHIAILQHKLTIKQEVAYELHQADYNVTMIKLLRHRDSQNKSENADKNLKIYRNKEFGFEFQYPSHLEVVVENATIILNDPEYVDEYWYTGEYRVKDLSSDPSYDDGSEFVMSSFAAYGASSTFPNGRLTVNGYDAISWIEFEFAQQDYVVLRNQDGRLVRLQVPNGISGMIDNHQVVGDRELIEKDPVISTFQFIERSSTSNWKTYRNEEFGFEFQYPNDVELINLATSGTQKLSLFIRSIEDHGEGLGTHIDVAEYEESSLSENEIIQTWGILDFEEDCNDDNTPYILTCFSPILGSTGYVIAINESN